MSRGFINKAPDIFNRTQRWSGSEYTITFKRCREKYGVEDLTFGTTAGCDFMKGCNIDVIGTPHQPDWIYKLFAFSMGLDFNRYARSKFQQTEHNGVRFWFPTFEDKTLRDIQFYLIESELEQAVGRARLLRFDCTVNLFSNFPLLQANYLISEYDDLGR
ncbi:MAG: hypothetical protein FWG90_00220 [Oscillospiraceae bacterium]|nr:hypothetical protein [Oscillospiraceae bacterium]